MFKSISTSYFCYCYGLRMVKLRISANTARTRSIIKGAAKLPALMKSELLAEAINAAAIRLKFVIL